MNRVSSLQPIGAGAHGLKATKPDVGGRDVVNYDPDFSMQLAALHPQP
jgi:hypothetical protein